MTIPFAYTVPREERDPMLLERLLNERDAIVSRALESYVNLRDNGYRFSGNFAVNEIVQNESADSEDIKVAVYRFVKENFIETPNDVVYVTDAHQEFSDRHGFVALNDFSRIFAEVTAELYGAVRSRKRKPGAENAQSCLLNIKQKEE